MEKEASCKRKGIAESNIVGSGATITALNAAPPPTMGTNDLNAPPIPPTSGPPTEKTPAPPVSETSGLQQTKGRKRQGSRNKHLTMTAASNGPPIGDTKDESKLR